MAKSKKSSKSSKTSEKLSLTPELSKKQKTDRTKYLTSRINLLFQNFSEWIEGMEEYTLKKNTVSVDGVKLPFADILYKKKTLVSFKPTGLYAFGTNCRIDLISKNETNIIFDVAPESKPADWQLISSKPGKEPKKLSKIIFRNFLRSINNTK